MTVTIDDKEYEFDTLSDNAKQQIANIDVCDQEIEKLNSKLAITQTARNLYAKALKEALPKE
jgi:hypothetical protein